jgi:hypothetical protein
VLKIYGIVNGVNMAIAIGITLKMIIDWLKLLIVTDLEILVVLVTRLLRQDFDRLVNGMEPVELWDEG